MILRKAKDLHVGDWVDTLGPVTAIGGTQEYTIKLTFRVWTQGKTHDKTITVQRNDLLAICLVDED